MLEVLLHLQILGLERLRGVGRRVIAAEATLLLSRRLLLHELRLILPKIGIVIRASLSRKLLALLILVHHALMRAALRRKLLLKRLLMGLSNRVVGQSACKTAHVHRCSTAILIHSEMMLRIAFELHILLTCVLNV